MIALLEGNKSIFAFGSFDVNVPLKNRRDSLTGPMNTFNKRRISNLSSFKNEGTDLQSDEFEIDEMYNEVPQTENSESSKVPERSIRMQKMPRWFWRAHSQKRLRWDLYIMLLATINCFQIPYIVAFTDGDDSSWYSIVFNTIIDIWFMTDIIINFRTSYITPTSGEEIMNFKLIAFEYLKGRFWIDLLASIPFDYIVLIFSTDDSNSWILQTISLLKLVRVLRLSRLITHLNLKNEVKISLRLIKLVFFVVLYLHCIGCIWFYIVDRNRDWIPPLDYVYITTELYGKSNIFQYFTSLYHSVLMLGGNDIGPRGNFQLFLVSLILFIGAIINSIIFGNMGVMLQSLNRKSSAFQEKVENATEAMKNLKVTDEIRDDVEYYLTFTQSALDHQKELDEFLNMLSPSLKQRVLGHVFKDSIMINPVFRNSSDVADTILNHLTIKLFMPEEVIVRQFEHPDSMYFISNGQCDVYVTDSSKSEKFVKTLNEGSHFGEVAIIKDCRRTASVISHNYSTWAQIEQEDFKGIMVMYPFIKKTMEKHMRIDYRDKWKTFIKRSLRNIDYLSEGIPDVIIDEISYMLEPITVNTGSYIFKRGTPWKEILIITNGEVDTFLGNSKKEMYFDTLYTGCSIGAYGILNGSEHSFSGKAKTNCSLLKFSHANYLKIRERFDLLDEVWSQFETYIEENGLPYCDYKLYRPKSLQMTPYDKLRSGIRRIIRIVKFYQSTWFTDLLEKVQKKIAEK